MRRSIGPVSLEGPITTKQLSKSIGTVLMNVSEENIEREELAASFEKVHAKERFLVKLSSIRAVKSA